LAPQLEQICFLELALAQEHFNGELVSQSLALGARHETRANLFTYIFILPYSTRKTPLWTVRFFLAKIKLKKYNYIKFNYIST